MTEEQEETTPVPNRWQRIRDWFDDRKRELRLRRERKNLDDELNRQRAEARRLAHELDLAEKQLMARAKGEDPLQRAAHLLRRADEFLRIPLSGGGPISMYELRTWRDEYFEWREQRPLHRPGTDEGLLPGKYKRVKPPWPYSQRVGQYEQET